MKWILIFLCLPAFGQLPVLPFGSQVNSLGVQDYRTNLYVDYESDTTTSLKNYGNGVVVTAWTNISGKFVPGSSWDAITSSGVWPYYTNNVTPTGQPAIDFRGNNNSIGANIPHWGASGSNQPNTIIMVLMVRSNAVQFFFDNISSTGRNFIDVVPNTSYGFFANAGVTVNNPTVTNQFFILTCLFNGANSYFRTNGVLLGAGNPSTGPMGNLMLGNDQTGATPFTGLMAAFRIYGEAMSTNNLHIAEQNLATRYLGVTLPSP